MDCGDGVEFRVFKQLGYTNVIGVELDRDKVKVARELGYPVVEADMQNLHMLKTGTSEIVYSSHTLEHADYPAKVIRGFHRILKEDGELYIILPYPDTNYLDEEGHVAKYELGTSWVST